ncbi:MAG: amidase family protein, partial [Alphaproteobacteria bacterium]
VQEESPMVDTIGFFVRAVEDLPLLMDAAVRNKPGAWSVSSDRAPRIGVIRGPAWANVQPAMAEAIDRAAAALARAGAAVEKIAPAPVLEELQQAMQVVLRYESPRMWAYEIAAKNDLLSPGLRQFARDAASVTADDFIAALRTAELARGWIADTFAAGGVDAFLTASAPGEAPEGLGSTGTPAMNQAWTLSHSPCITLPFGKGPKGLPLGIQLVGARYDDAKLIAVAQWVEARLQG